MTAMAFASRRNADFFFDPASSVQAGKFSTYKLYFALIAVRL